MEFHSSTLLYHWLLTQFPGFTGGSEGKESARNAGDSGLIPGSSWSIQTEWQPLQCSWLQDPMRREESDRLQSMGSQRVRHDLETEQQQQKFSRHMKASSVFMVLITCVATGSSPPTPPLLAGCHPLTLPSSLTPAAHDLVCRKRPESLIPTKIISHYQS